ncbi:MAG: Calx-beta domain-containing protein, partial [Verrucomicrobiota bacterium]
DDQDFDCHAPRPGSCLVSPDGTKSILANGGTAAEARRLGDDKDYSYRVFNAPKQDVGWTFTSTHHWGENSIGTWKVVVRDKFVNRTNYPVFNRTDNSVKIGKILSASVHVYGVPSTAQRLKFEQGQYTVTEPNNDGDGSPSLLKINVQRLGSPAGIAQVDFTTSVRGTATAAVNEAVNPDYAPIGGTITFGDGEISKEISIPIFHDTLAEEDEVIYLLLKNTRGASLGGINLASIRIRDNDNNNVTVTAPDATSTEPTQGVAANNATFVISRTVPSPTALVVNYALSGSAKLGTAQGEDFTLSPSSTVMTATIPPNETSTTITVLAREDGTIEGTETVDLTVLPEIGGAYAIGVPSTAQVRILDHDRPFVRITADQNLLKENDETRTVQLRIERYVNDASTVSSITAVPLVVDLSYAGTQINNQHYRDADTKLALPDKVVIPAGETAVTLNVEARQDSVYQALKSVVISFANTPTRDFDFGFPSSVNLTILEDDPLPDSVVPRVTLTEPKNNSRIVFPAEVTVSGAASDNGTISGIEYRINGSQWKAVDAENVTAINQPSTAWSFKLNLPESGDAEIRYGFNNLEVASVDNDGNRARLSSSTFKYVKEQKLNVALAGNGAVSIPVGESTREAGVSYTVSARPASGQVFKGWTGLVTSPSRTISFVMPPNDAALTAEFVASPFSSTVAGRYTGLVRGTTFSSDSSGYLDLNVTSGGLFSGKFLLPGLSYGFKGEFSGQGRFVGVIPRKNDLPFEVDLTIDLAADGTQRVTGTISSSNGILTVKADRAAFGRGTPAPAELVKNYTIILPPNDPLGNVQFDPQGNGYGTAKIDASGVVRANVTLGDGTKVVLAQPLNKNREWVFYSQPYQRKGVVLGIMTHSDQSDSDFNGKVDWFKPARSNDRIYPLGFTVKNNDVLGSLYEIPASGTVLDFATSAGKGEVSLLEGNIVNPIIKVVTLDSSNKLTIQTAGEDALNFNINARSGTFSGSFAHPVSSKRTPINGVIFQKQNIGVGTFTGSSIPGIEVRTGKILLEAFEPVGATISR